MFGLLDSVLGYYFCFLLDSIFLIFSIIRFDGGGFGDVSGVRCNICFGIRLSRMCLSYPFF